MINRPIVKVSWSGGKDSTAAALLHMMSGHKVICVCYIPYYDDETPLISKEHFEFLQNTGRKFEQEFGATVIFVHGLTYKGFVTSIISKGKNKGKIKGFPYFARCNFKNFSKIPAIKSVDKLYNLKYDYEDIGIAFDEVQRYNNIDGIKHRSILKELHVTEDVAFNFCKRNGVLSPHYKDNKRDGCALCPNARKEEREKWLNEYNKREDVKELENLVKSVWGDERRPLRGKRYFT